jgi:hypothetical protein
MFLQLGPLLFCAAGVTRCRTMVWPVIFVRSGPYDIRRGGPNLYGHTNNAARATKYKWQRERIRRHSIFWLEFGNQMRPLAERMSDKPTFLGVRSCLKKYHKFND